ncbi:MAG TPA: hypothetical protein VFU76_02375 [Terriglobales bacterium]|nr:hypothetical protein [Terriglobales bacterium]
MDQEYRPQEAQTIQAAEPASRMPLQGYGAAIVIAVLALCVGLMGYAFHERGQADHLAAQNQQISASLNTTQAQIAALTDKINQMTAAEQERQAAVQRRAVTRRRVAAHPQRRADDPRWKKMQSELDDTRQQIEATRSDLNGAKTELSAGIAKNHQEVVLLQRKGERNYYEFDIDKTKQFRAAGPVGIKLKKANTKHQYADLQLMVDDAQLDKKHVNLFEPVVFLNTDSGQPVQLVVQSITKNHIHGYVSEPKYRASELAAGSADAASSPTSTQPPVRKRLTIPQE